MPYNIFHILGMIQNNTDTECKKLLGIQIKRMSNC